MSTTHVPRPTSHVPQGVFIVFEGPEGSGKSTQARRLAAALRRRGARVRLTHEPGDTPLGRGLRRLLLGSRLEIDARAEALLYMAERLEHLRLVVRPALARGDVVISDRYLDSTLVYQGDGLGADRMMLEWVGRWVTGGVRPDLTILLDLEPRIGLRRAGRPDRIERRDLAFHRRVRAGYLRLARRAPSRYVILDAGQPIGRLRRAIETLVLDRLTRRHGAA